MFSATNGGEGCLEGKKEGEPLFPRIRILQKFVFRSNGAVLRSAKRNSDGRRRVCRMVLSLYFRAGIRGHGITLHRSDRLKLLYTFVKNWRASRRRRRAVPRLVACEERTRGEKGWKHGGFFSLKVIHNGER